MTAIRLGFLAGAAVVTVGVGYVLLLALGFAHYGLSEPIGDPILAAMEALTLVSVLPFVMLVGAILIVIRPHGSRSSTQAR